MGNYNRYCLVKVFCDSETWDCLLEHLTNNKYNYINFGTVIAILEDEADYMETILDDWELNHFGY